jgi:hypothetical protein
MDLSNNSYSDTSDSDNEVTNNVTYITVDTSHNVIIDASHNISDISYNTDLSCNISDISYNQPIDVSCNNRIPHVVPIIDVSYNNVVDGVGYEISHTGGEDVSGNHIKRTTFETDEPELYDPQIKQNLTHTVKTYDDTISLDSSANILVEQIKGYAQQLDCSDFHGKGSINDYNELFIAAGRIANESKQMELDVDIEGFNEFAAAADELSNLFNGFILKLQNVSIITDIQFLTSVSYALSRIVNLSETFGRFKQTIFSTSAVQLPQSAHQTREVVEEVMNDINCAMNYINYFVCPDDVSLNTTQYAKAQLSQEEQNIISKSVQTIDNWNNLCQYGVSIAMSNDVDIQYIQTASNHLKHKSISVRNSCNILRTKLASYNIHC